MEPHLIHLTKADYAVSQWSGGTTTQIAIAPQGAQYGDRDFLWRLSSATVDLAESDFTPLPDYHRLIAPLKGEMILTHDGGVPVTLEPCQVHAFDGGAATHSVGKGVDFNLMLRKGKCTGRIYPIETAAAQTVTFTASPKADELLLYCAEGEGTVSFCSETVHLRPGEAVRVQAPSSGLLTLDVPERAVLMAAEIQTLT